jgi:hypothetical protein
MLDLELNGTDGGCWTGSLEEAEKQLLTAALISIA